MITFTIDLEDHLEAYAPNGRWLWNTRRILDFCATRRIRATFFAVGRVAKASPQLLQDIVAGGHELALHSHDHMRLTRESADHFAPRIAAAKKAFEDITGKRVAGFRAPMFSLVPETYWAVDILKKAGFSYSSSVIPGKGAFSGFPGAPTTPFLWPNGLIEIPVPAVRPGPSSFPFALPFLGGVYLRYLPLQAVAYCREKMPKNALLWTYTHPYDVDGDEGFVRLQDGTPLWANALLMYNRAGFLKKLGLLLEAQAGAPLAARVARLSASDLPVFTPGKDLQG
jgi:polysaccharide deacetylase family protein (PEP-CTERM system associated)